jgi:metal-dependent amidase/aminoacylase/carboxypeptidase family protein
LETREKLLSGIKRIAENMGRVAGMPEDMLPEVKVISSTPPTVNDNELAARLKAVWVDKMGEEVVFSNHPSGMGAEDFPYFTTNPQIKSVYWGIGGTDPAVWAAAQNGGKPIPSHHSPFFKVEPESVMVGVESTVYALMALMPKK